MYDTPLDMQQMVQYLRDFGKRAQGDEKDYDLRGAWLSGARPGPNGHFTDQFKKPNHPTFSEESQYSIPVAQGGIHQGGYWADSNANGISNTFTPSPEMYSDQERMRQLAKYLRGPAEKGHVLMVPPTISAPRSE